MWLPRHCMKGIIFSKIAFWIAHSGGNHTPYIEEVQEVLWTGPHMEETIDWHQLPGIQIAHMKVDLPAPVKTLHI